MDIQVQSIQNQHTPIVIEQTFLQEVNLKTNTPLGKGERAGSLTECSVFQADRAVLCFLWGRGNL